MLHHHPSRGDFTVFGDFCVNESVEIDLGGETLHVTGSFVVKGDLLVSGSLHTINEDIRVDGDIGVKGNLLCGDSITAKSIFASGSLEADRDIVTTDSAAPVGISADRILAYGAIKTSSKIIVEQGISAKKGIFAVGDIVAAIDIESKGNIEAKTGAICSTRGSVSAMEISADFGVSGNSIRAASIHVTIGGILVTNTLRVKRVNAQQEIKVGGDVQNCDLLQANKIDCEGRIEADNIVVAESIFAREGIIASCIYAGEDIRGGFVSASHSVTAGGEIALEKSLEAKSNIRAVKGIKVGGRIKTECVVKSEGCIEAALGIDAGASIYAKTNISTCLGIISAGDVVAGTYICTENAIFAGVKLCLDKEKTSGKIQCAEFRQGKIACGELVLTSRTE